MQDALAVVRLFAFLVEVEVAASQIQKITRLDGYSMRRLRARCGEVYADATVAWLVPTQHIGWKVASVLYNVRTMVFVPSTRQSHR